MSREHLEIGLLGELAVRRGGVPEALPASRKTRALLGFLAESSRPQPRSRLCELLWDGPVDPRAELRWSLSKIRRLFAAGGDAEIEVVDDAVGLRSIGLRVDAEELRSIVATGGPEIDLVPVAALERAAALFRGELLAGLELPDCYRFNAWLIAARERYAAIQTRLLARLSRIDERGPLAALAWGRSWVAVDPLDEAAHVSVVRALVALGKVKEARLQIETCRRILRQELGAAPGEALGEALRQAPLARPIAEMNRPESVPDAPVVEAGAGSIVPFVGREDELAVLESSVHSFVLIEGEPGIGKSRLLAEHAGVLAGRGAVVLSARGYETESSRPFGLWLDLAGESSAGATLFSAIPSLMKAGKADDDPIDREKLLLRLAAAFSGAAAGNRPVVLCVDDLQWVDEASLTLLHALVTDRLAGGGPGMRVIAGARSGEIAERSPAAKLIRDLKRDGRVVRLSLGRLAHAECEQLVEAVSGASGTSGTSLAGELARVSAGHPLFAIELARSSAVLAAGVPATLQAVIGERLARLGDDARVLAAFGAAIGAAFDVEWLAEVAELPLSRLLPALDELERLAIFRAADDGASYDFGHDLLRRVAYEQCAPPRRRFLHGVVARALVPRAREEETLVVTLARQAALGGLSLLAAESHLRAAKRGLRLTAVVESEEHCERGLGLLHELSAADTLTLRFELLRTLVHATQGRPRRAGLAAEVKRWVEVARVAGAGEALQVGLYLLATLTYSDGDLSAAERHALEQAEALRGAEPAVAARALANAGRCLAQIERGYARAEALLRDGRDRAARAGIDVIDIPLGLGLVAQAAGRDEEAELELARALALARREQDPWVESQCLARLAALAIDRGAPVVGAKWSAELAELAAKTGDGGEAAIAGALAALAECLLGRAGSSARFAEALKELRLADSKLHLAFVLNQVAAMELRDGNFAAAEAHAAEALEFAVRIGRHGQVARSHLLLARVASEKKERARARREIRAAMATNRPYGTLGGRLWSEILELASALAIPTLQPMRRSEDPARKGGPS